MDPTGLAAASVLLQSMSLSVGSWHNKDGNWTIFVEFCRRFDLSAFPCETTTLVLYMTFLACVHSTSYLSIKNILFTIKMCHAAHGVTVPSPSED